MLKQSLAANALFSAGSAGVMLSTPAWLTSAIPAPMWLWLVLGAGLALFALQLAGMVFNEALRRKLAMQVVAADLGWIVATSIAMAVFWHALTSSGVMLILAINGIVGTLASLQYLGARRASWEG